MTPMEAWNGKKPSISHLKFFGSFAVALEKGHRKNKFDAKGKEYRMVGYSRTAKAYRLYDPSTGQVVEKRDVLFSELGDTEQNREASIIFDMPMGIQGSEDQIADGDGVDDEANVGIKNSDGSDEFLSAEKD
ncbi:hypothetical protein KR215_005817, partial [Drosophila sulfurigaster]